MHVPSTIREDWQPEENEERWDDGHHGVLMECAYLIHRLLLQSNLNSTTLVYTTPSILRHIFVRPNFLVQNSLSYTNMTLDNTTFRGLHFVILKRE